MEMLSHSNTKLFARIFAISQETAIARQKQLPEALTGNIQYPILLLKGFSRNFIYLFHIGVLCIIQQTVSRTSHLLMNWHLHQKKIHWISGFLCYKTIGV